MIRFNCPSCGMAVSATAIACAYIVMIGGAGVAQQGRSTRPKPAECYISALQHLARGDYKEAHEAARQANKLRPNYKPYEQLLAKLEPVAQRDKLRDYALAAGKDDEASIELLARYLKTEAKDDESKAWLLYCWITDRIAYDVKSFLSGDYTKKDYSPAGVLKQRLAVCDGYSKLFTAVGKEMGLDAVSIAGHAKGFGYREGVELDDKLGHAWNAVKIGDKWRPIDATWGAGSVDGEKFKKAFNDFYFFPPAQALILSHYPKKPEDQFLDKAIPLDQFKSWRKVEIRPLLQCGFASSAIQDILTRKTLPVEAFSVACPIRVQAPLERQLDTRKRYTIKVESLVLSDVAIIHAGKWYYSTKRGDVFTCTFRGMEGDMMVAVKPFGQKEYASIFKYQGVKGSGPIGSAK
jgi:hypothetical protein